MRRSSTHLSNTASAATLTRELLGLTDLRRGGAMILALILVAGAIASMVPVYTAWASSSLAPFAQSGASS